MKRKVLLLCAAGLLLCGCQAKEEPLLITGKLRAAVTSELENSEEIAEYIAQGIDAPLEVIQTDRTTAAEMLSHGSVDIAVGGYSLSNDPGLNYLMTMPVAENKVYVVCGSGLNVTSKTDLTGIVTGASSELPESVLRSLEDLAADGKLVCDNAETAADLLADGELSAYVCFEHEALELIKGNKELRSCIPSDIDSEQYSVIVLKGNTDLFSAVNRVVGEMITGEM